MAQPYYCKDENRRALVRSTTREDGRPVLNGIDYLEVNPEGGAETLVGQRKLHLHFIHPLHQPDHILEEWSENNIIIEGGSRIPAVKISSVKSLVLPGESTAKLLEIETDQAGDFSIYTLCLVNSATDLSPPPGIDPRLSRIEFSFKIGCPSDFDCREDPACPPQSSVQPNVHYLAKDFAGFRRLMLDRMSLLAPDWKERNPADLQIALVELMAYVADHLSYYQDAVGTEAYLGTARQRISLRRHARLLDYRMHEGCNARAWVYLDVAPGGGSDGLILRQGTALFTGSGEPVVASRNFSAAFVDQPLVFETMHDVKLRSAHNEIQFYTWSDGECCLPKGSTRATLSSDRDLDLHRGDVLILEEVKSPVTGKAADADPTRRHAIRLTRVDSGMDPLTQVKVVNIEWGPSDALPFPLCLSTRLAGETGNLVEESITVARGNIVLADHGRMLDEEALDPPVVSAAGKYRPKLQRRGLTYRMPYDHDAAVNQPAVQSIHQDPEKALPQVTLLHRGEDWTPAQDLLASGRFHEQFVVEMEEGDRATLRFGDDILGKRPAEGTQFTASYRIGGGTEGNVGAEAIRRVVSDAGGIRDVRNPMPASGGVQPEKPEEVRHYAPQAFRTQERAVTESDWGEMARRHPEVQKAIGRFRWTGSWYTVFLSVDRLAGAPVDQEFKEELVAFLEKYRITGYDLEILGPRFVSLHLELTICVGRDRSRSDVHQDLVRAFSNQNLPEGARGFFHPDHFTFGQSLFLSCVQEHAMAVDGVESVSIVKFQELGRSAQQTIDEGVIKPEALEILRLDNDPNFPEHGKILFMMEGGL